MSIPTPVVVLLVALLALAGCSGDDSGDTSADATTESSAPTAEATASNRTESCQAIVGSGAVEDIQVVFDKYKNTSNQFTAADATKMRDALDALAKAGDNAAPKIREDVVQLVADAGSFIDSRIDVEGVGKVASVETIQKGLDSLCR